MTPRDRHLSAVPSLRELAEDVRDLSDDRDRLLDPETGIYARLAQMEGRLKNLAVSILVGVLLNLVALIHYH